MQRIGIKICGLTRKEDMEAAARSGATALGMFLTEGPGQLSDAEALELLRASDHLGVDRVAVLGRTSQERINEVAGWGFEGLQVVIEDQSLAAPEGAYLLPVFFDGDDLIKRIDRYFAAHTGNNPELINIDGPGGGGVGSRADWDRVAEVSRNYPVMLAGGLKVSNLEQAMTLVRPQAVDVCSGVGAGPGVKDPQKIDAFVSEVRRVEGLIGEHS